MKLKYLLPALLAVGMTLPASAQKVALKTNLVSDALLSPSLGIEVGLSRKWTLDLDAQVNFWTVNQHEWKHMLFQPEARYWFCRSFAGHFLGFHALAGQYNVGNLDLDLKFLGSDFRGLKTNRYEGWGVGAGVAYGYSWPVHPHWNIEAEIGLGWIYTRYDSYPCTTCGNRRRERHPHNYAGPTKAAINIVYIIK